MITHKLIVKENISEDTIERLDTFVQQQDIGKHFELVIENNYIVPRIMLEWLSKMFAGGTYTGFDLHVTEERLYLYLRSLGFPVKMHHKQDEFCSIRAIVIGGSAGSSEMVTKMLSALKPSKLSIFIVQHATQTDLELFQRALKNFSSSAISYPKHLEKVEEGKIYLAPPDHHMRIVEGKILLDHEDEFNFARPSLSIFYKSFAKEYHQNGLCITSCGYGRDGSDAIEKLYAEGTHIIIQEPSECEAKMLPASMAKTQRYSHVLSIELISELLQWYTNNNFEEKTALFFPLLHKIYGYDFTHYNLDSIQRLLEGEMQRCSCIDKNSFFEHILLKKDAFEKLFFALTVNVTEFFRKPDALIALKEMIKEEAKELSSMKFWIAGCASGEEAYTLAMILYDQELLENSLIYATDIDETMVQIARNGCYSKNLLNKSASNAQSVLHNKIFKDYIESKQHFFSIKETLRKKTLFFKHNLITDGSFNEFNLILCKNVIIYFDMELQKKVFQLFYESLTVGGFLQLGASETLLFEFRDKFQVVDIRNKIFQKV